MHLLDKGRKRDSTMIQQICSMDDGSSFMLVCLVKNKDKEYVEHNKFTHLSIIDKKLQKLGVDFLIICYSKSKCCEQQSTSGRTCSLF